MFRHFDNEANTWGPWQAETPAPCIYCGDGPHHNASVPGFPHHDYRAVQ